MGHRVISVVVPRDVHSCVPPIGFVHKISAETYIAHRGLDQTMRIKQMTVYDEFDDVAVHAQAIQRQEALNKLSHADKVALGLIGKQ